MHIVNREFVEFGRTTCYFIDDMFNIVPGVVQMADELGRYIVEYKVPGTPNQYELIRLTIDTIRYTIEDAKTYLIQLLKEHISNNFVSNITINNIPNDITDIKLLIYMTGDDIYEIEPIDIVKGKVENNTIVLSGIKIIDYNKTYFGIIETNKNEILETSLMNASVYNDGFNIIMDYTQDCHSKAIPDDYYSYKIQLSGLENIIDNKIKAYITPFNINEVLAYTDVKTIEENTIAFNRFVKEDHTFDGLTYYRPGIDDKYKQFDLYVDINTDIYKFSSPIEDFTIDTTYDLSNFVKVS